MAAGLKYVEELGAVTATIVAPIPLPVAVATWIGSAAPTVGQKAMAASLPVAIASDQSTLPVKEIRSSVGTSSNVASNVASVTLLAANAARLGATFVQDGAGGVLMLKLGGGASAVSFTVILQNRDYYELPAGYTGIVDGIWAPAVGSVRVTELT